MAWTIARSDNNLNPTPPNPAVFPRSSIATVPYEVYATNWPKAVWCEFVNQSDDLVSQLTALGATVRTDHWTNVGVRAVGSVAGVWDDSRVSTPDGSYFVPGVVGEGLLGGNLTALNGATAFTLMVPCVQQPGFASTGSLFYRATAASVTGCQLGLFSTGTRLDLFVGNGVTALARIASAASSVESGPSYIWFVRFDGAAGTDATKVTFFRAIYNPLTGAVGTVTQSASQVITAGVPSALITLASANISVGRRPFATDLPFFGLIGQNDLGVRGWNAALTEAQMNAELASATPVIAAQLNWTFAGATPLTNAGSWGATGDLTAGPNTVLCSGDRRWAQSASPGTSRPSITTLNGIQVVAYDGVNDYSRNVSRGQLEGITAGAMDVFIGVIPADTATVKTMGALSVSTTNALSMARRDLAGTDNLQAQTSATAGDGALTTTIPTGVRVVFARRTASGAGTTALRVGLGTEITDSETPASAGAVTRMTFAANQADTPAQFADETIVRKMTLTGLTTAAQIEAAQEVICAWAAAYAGATV